MSQQHQVWYPENSYKPANVGSEEGGRGSLHGFEPDGTTVPSKKKVSANPKRRTPAVSIPYPATASDSNSSTKTETEEKRDGYKTIEVKSDEGLILHRLSSVPYTSTKPPAPKNHNSFNGWTNYEYFDLHQSSKTNLEGNKTRLQTPTEENRGCYQSRASSSRYRSSHSVRRRYEYTFHHYDDKESHIENYHDLYSFTALNTASRQEEEKLFCEGEDVEQDEEVLLPLDVKSLYRGDPYLRELISRLGIRESPNFQDRDRQLLLSPPQPTPPSITKRRRRNCEMDDVVVSNSGSKRQTGRDAVNVESVPPAQSSSTSDRMSRPSSRLDPNQHDELPKIAHSSEVSQLLRELYQSKKKKKKSNSVISLNKYLHVKSNNQDTLKEEDEEECDEDRVREKLLLKEEIHNIDFPAVSRTDKRHDITHNSTKDRSKDVDTVSGVRSSPSRDKGIHYRDVDIVSGEHDNRNNARIDESSAETGQHKTIHTTTVAQEHLLTLNREQKEKLLSNTAHSLGVVSRDWTKTSGIRKMIGAHFDDKKIMSEFQSPTRLAKSRTGSRMGQSDVSKPSTATRKERYHSDTVKIEKLKSIYDSNHSPKKRAPSRQPSRCESRLTSSRPGTRIQGRRIHDNTRRTVPSRPVTRAGTSQKHTVGNLECLDESTYWNELPVNVTNKKTTTNNSGTRATDTDMAQEPGSSKVIDPLFAQQSAKGRHNSYWYEGFSFAGTNTKHNQRNNPGMKSDGMAHTIALAMRFRKPREVLMKKIMGDLGGPDHGNERQGSTGSNSKVNKHSLRSAKAK